MYLGGLVEGTTSISKEFTFYDWFFMVDQVSSVGKGPTKGSSSYHCCIIFLNFYTGHLIIELQINKAQAKSQCPKDKMLIRLTLHSTSSLFIVYLKFMAGLVSKGLSETHSMINRNLT